jgi:hypothetical protein
MRTVLQTKAESRNSNVLLYSLLFTLYSLLLTLYSLLLLRSSPYTVTLEYAGSSIGQNCLSRNLK